MFSEEKALMKKCISKKHREWAWFLGLWLLGLISIATISYVLKKVLFWF